MTRCLRCGEPLTDERSAQSGIGPRCWSRALRRARELRGFTPEQKEKALELIETQGIVRLRKRKVWMTVSSKGTRIYRTAPQACTCEGGIYHGRCYHQAAALLLQ